MGAHISVPPELGDHICRYNKMLHYPMRTILSHAWLIDGGSKAQWSLVNCLGSHNHWGSHDAQEVCHYLTREGGRRSAE